MSRTRLADERPPTGGLADLAHIAVCAGCGVTHISCIRRFPDIYRCVDCLTDRDLEIKRKTAEFLATSPTCKHGHPLTAETLRVSVIGRRRCLTCFRARDKDAKARTSIFHESAMGYYEWMGYELDRACQKEDLR